MIKINFNKVLKYTFFLVLGFVLSAQAVITIKIRDEVTAESPDKAQVYEVALEDTGVDAQGHPLSLDHLLTKYIDSIDGNDDASKKKKDRLNNKGAFGFMIGDKPLSFGSILSMSYQLSQFNKEFLETEKVLVAELEKAQSDLDKLKKESAEFADQAAKVQDLEKRIALRAQELMPQLVASISKEDFQLLLSGVVVDKEKIKKDYPYIADAFLKRAETEAPSSVVVITLTCTSIIDLAAKVPQALQQLRAIKVDKAEVEPLYSGEESQLDAIKRYEYARKLFGFQKKLRKDVSQFQNKVAPNGTVIEFAADHYSHVKKNADKIKGKLELKYKAVRGKIEKLAGELEKLTQLSALDMHKLEEIDKKIAELNAQMTEKKRSRSATEWENSKVELEEKKNQEIKKKMDLIRSYIATLTEMNDWINDINTLSANVSKDDVSLQAQQLKFSIVTAKNEAERIIEDLLKQKAENFTSFKVDSKALNSNFKSLHGKLYYDIYNSWIKAVAQKDKMYAAYDESPNVWDNNERVWGEKDTTKEKSAYLSEGHYEDKNPFSDGNVNSFFNLQKRIGAMNKSSEKFSQYWQGKIKELSSQVEKELQVIIDNLRKESPELQANVYSFLRDKFFEFDELNRYFDLNKEPQNSNRSAHAKTLVEKLNFMKRVCGDLSTKEYATVKECEKEKLIDKKAKRIAEKYSDTSLFALANKDATSIVQTVWYDTEKHEGFVNQLDNPQDVADKILQKSLPKFPGSESGRFTLIKTNGTPLNQAQSLGAQKAQEGEHFTLIEKEFAGQKEGLLLSRLNRIVKLLTVDENAKNAAYYADKLSCGIAKLTEPNSNDARNLGYTDFLGLAQEIETVKDQLSPDLQTRFDELVKTGKTIIEQDVRTLANNSQLYFDVYKELFIKKDKVARIDPDTIKDLESDTEKNKKIAAELQFLKDALSLDPKHKLVECLNERVGLLNDNNVPEPDRSYKHANITWWSKKETTSKVAWVSGGLFVTTLVAYLLATQTKTGKNAVQKVRRGLARLGLINIQLTPEQRKELLAQLKSLEDIKRDITPDHYIKAREELLNTLSIEERNDIENIARALFMQGHKVEQSVVQPQAAQQNVIHPQLSQMPVATPAAA